MIEQFKAILLFILVALSLFLTYQLWYGQKPAELIADDVYEQVDMEKPRLPEEAIEPVNIVLSNEVGDFLFRKGDVYFDQLWEELSWLLKEFDSDFSAEQNLPDEEALNCLTYYFSPFLPAGEDMPWLTGISKTSIEKIKFYCLDDSYWLVIDKSELEAEKIMLLTDEELEGLRDLISAVSTENEIVYILLTTELISELFDRDIEIRMQLYVPDEEVFLDKLNLKAENFDRDLILKNFFVDYNLARIIEEKDGGLIYTDGEKGLRLTDVSLEYSYPRLEEGQTTLSYNDALHKCRNLISYYGGWPENLRLEKLTKSGRGWSIYYISAWMVYHEGYPIYVRQPTRAFFNDLGLFHFTRSLFYPEKTDDRTEDKVLIQDDKREPVAGWSEALQKAIKVFSDWSLGIEPRLRLEDINLGYVITGPKHAPEGIPAWFIKINGEEIFLEADTLKLISEEDML